MTDSNAVAPASTLELAKDLVTEYLRHNQMDADAVPAFLATVHGKLVDIARAAVPLAAAAQAAPASPEFPPRGEPAVPVDQSITADGEFIICLEDGTKHKMMKRYLKRVHNMTPEQYKDRWGLDASYPMTAPAYSAQKRDEAKAVGLGTAANKAGAPARVAIAA